MSVSRDLMRACLGTVLLLFSLGAAAQQQWNLVWSDEFDGATNALPNPAKWAYDNPNAGSGNQELETYCGQAGAGQTGDCSNWRTNAYLDGQGNLVISAILHTNGQWTSARLFTHTKFTFTYGRVEARMKLPIGTGLWPAFWMLGDNIFSGATWPNCGEQDIMENVTQLGPSTIRSSLHGPNYSTNSTLHANYTIPGGGRVDTAYHVYGVIWTTNSIQYYVDDYTKPYVVFTPASMPPGGIWAFNDHPFFLLLNLAVGGTWPGPPDGTTPSPANMYVDYVRVYQPAPSPGFYEAEKALVSGAIITNTAVGYSGTGYVHYQDANADYIEWAFNLPFASTEWLRFRYANGDIGNRPLELKVNGGVVNPRLNFPSTGSWANWTTASNSAPLVAGSNTVRLTAIGYGGGNLDSLMVGAGAIAPAGLALRFAFSDAPGGTATPSDTNVGGANVTLQMFNSNNAATDFHGLTGSGVLNLGRALDLSSAPNGGTASRIAGGTARATSLANLGFGTVTTFTATVWFKLDSMFTNTLNAGGGRLFILGTNGVTDEGSANSVSFYFFNQNQLQYRIGTDTVAAVYGSNVPTNSWLYYAIVYDGVAARVYAGSETSPATLVTTTNDLAGPESINFGASGTLLVGNRLFLDRAFDGWIEDLRFYTYAPSANVVEDIRWSSLGPTGLTVSPAAGQVALSWTGLSGAGSYNVLRSTNSGSGYALIANAIAGTTYTDVTVVPGLTYYYVVSAVDASGDGKTSQNSTQAAITAPPPALTPMYSGTELTLFWPAAATNFNLYSTPDLAPPVVWSRVTNSTVSQAGKLSLSLPIESGVRFFRLSMP